MATITELREKLQAGEVLILPAASLRLFMQECQNHPVGEERYKVEPHSKGVSKVYDPLRVRTNP